MVSFSSYDGNLKNIKLEMLVYTIYIIHQELKAKYFVLILVIHNQIERDNNIISKFSSWWESYTHTPNM